MTTSTITKFDQLIERAEVLGRKAFDEGTQENPYADADLAAAWQRGYDVVAQKAAGMRTTVPVEDGVYGDITDILYHSDKTSLSSSGARALLPPSCPAIFQWEREHRTFKREYDFGHAAHLMVLGEGSAIVEIDADSWRTKAAKEEAAAARDEGKVPLLTAEVRKAEAMAAKVREHPLASLLFSEGGVAEQSIYWHDEATGVRLRARPDWLTPAGVVDYKTSTTASPRELAKKFNDYGYHQQNAFYRDGLAAVGLRDPDAPFLFVVQSKTAPYLVTVVEHTSEAIEVGRQLNRQAIELYARCCETDTWPGYAETVHTIDLPAYAYRGDIQ